MTYPSRRRKAEIHADQIATLTAENERLREALVLADRLLEEEGVKDGYDQIKAALETKS